jgi:TP901-1 family phage major tail protein
MAGELLSKDLILKIYNVAAAGYVTVARCTSYTMEVEKETVDVTSFDSGGWRSFLVDLKSFSFSADGLVIRSAESGKRTYEELLTDMIGSDATIIVQLVNPAIYTDATDGELYGHEIGNCYITSLPLTGAVGDKQTYSLTLQGTGTLTHVTAKFDTQAEATTAAQDNSFTLGQYPTAASEILENDVVFVEDDVDGSNNGYYYRNDTAFGSVTVFADAWVAYTP